MALADTFRVDTPTLQNLLEKVGKGELRLPDFQRGWVWDDSRIKAIIASISQNYPIGAIMGMETGGVIAFNPLLFEGVPGEKATGSAEMLILDGQQRLTSLFLALKSQSPVKTRDERGKDMHRWYYLDMALCLTPNVDIDDAILSLPADKKITSDFGRQVDMDLSTRENEYSHGRFPLNLVFDTNERLEWLLGYQEHFQHSPEKNRFVGEFMSNLSKTFDAYKIPIIVLSKSTPKVAVCTVFENVNTGGVPLTVFELLTATFAVGGYQLRKDWEERQARLRAISKNLHGVDETDFLAAVTLYASYQKNIARGSAVSCKRKDILNLTLDEYTTFADHLIEGFRKAAKFLHTQKIFDSFNLPYKTQLIPLSAVCAALANAYDISTTQDKLSQWYWCGALGELYGSANETRYALDMQQVPKWISSGEAPVTVRDCNFTPTRLLSLQTRNSAAYKGLTALLMRHGCLDFISGQPMEITDYFDEAVDIHHIFPAAHCEKQGYNRQIWNSVVNKAPLSARTNRILGGRAPSAYIEILETRPDYRVPPDSLDSHLYSHLIDSSLLRADSFEAFIISRANNLLDLIQSATGKNIPGRDSDETIEAFGGPLM